MGSMEGSQKDDFSYFAALPDCGDYEAQEDLWETPWSHFVETAPKEPAFQTGQMLLHDEENPQDNTTTSDRALERSPQLLPGRVGVSQPSIGLQLSSFPEPSTSSPVSHEITSNRVNIPNYESKPQNFSSDGAKKEGRTFITPVLSKSECPRVVDDVHSMLDTVTPDCSQAASSVPKLDQSLNVENQRIPFATSISLVSCPSPAGLAPAHIPRKSLGEHPFESPAPQYGDGWQGMKQESILSSAANYIGGSESNPTAAFFEVTPNSTENALFPRAEKSLHTINLPQSRAKKLKRETEGTHGVESSMTARRLASTAPELPSSLTNFNPNRRKNVPSKYCHICTRSVNSVPMAFCANIKEGKCRKIVCSKCASQYNMHDVLACIQDPMLHLDWTCSHCRNVCPSKAQCTTYARINKERRMTNKKSSAQGKNRLSPAFRTVSVPDALSKCETLGKKSVGRPGVTSGIMHAPASCQKESKELTGISPEDIPSAPEQKSMLQESPDRKHSTGLHSLFPNQSSPSLAIDGLASGDGKAGKTLYN